MLKSADYTKAVDNVLSEAVPDPPKRQLLKDGKMDPTTDLFLGLGLSSQIMAGEAYDLNKLIDELSEKTHCKRIKYIQSQDLEACQTLQDVYDKVNACFA